MNLPDRSQNIYYSGATRINPLFVPTQVSERWYWLTIVENMRFGIINEAWVMVTADRAEYAPIAWEFA